MKTHSRIFSNSKRTSSVLSLAALTLGVGLSASQMGCSGEANGGSFSSTLASVDVDQEAGFSVTPTFSNAIQSNTHIFGAFTSACAVSSTQDPTDQKCMTNVREQDVFMNEMSIGVNVPAGMCKYLEEIPYVYYNRRPGNGAASFYIEATDGVISYCEVNGVPTTPTTGGGFCKGAGSQITSAGVITCNFDYSKNVPAGPNCCIGNYSFTMKKTTNTVTAPVPPATAPTTTTSVTTSSGNGSYGGVPGQCMAGPGASKLWPSHVTDGKYKGYPGNVIIKVPDNGYAAVIENRIPIVYVGGANDTVSISNFFFNWSSYLSAGNNVTTALPAAIDPSAITDGLSLGILPGHAAWEFLCEDESREVRHRIRLYVNEWDTNDQLSKYLASGGTQGNPSNLATDQEGGGCLFGGSISYGYCNDYFSLRDYAVGNYGAGTTYGSIGSFPGNIITDVQTATTN